MLERDYIQPPAPRKIEQSSIMETQAEITFDGLDFKATLFYWLEDGQCFLDIALICDIDITPALSEKEKYDIELKLDNIREQKLEYYRNLMKEV